ncbi:MAG: hypothetical protein K2L79_03540, partial [Bacteroidales bacterium]|nr:hypothetical protein [Bacteroidales bacterium]
NDLKEGKITLPTLFYLRTLDEAGRRAFFDWLQRPAQWQAGELAERLTQIRRSGAEDYCRQRMAAYAQQAQDAFARLGIPQPRFEELLKRIFL